ncbi:MAG: triose-phosphate isomerase [Euryarchaeota archaeon]|nr:triose-phosphate isomerase [Euryarchaeota archaeon]
MTQPLICVNFKIHSKAFGKEAENLSSIMAEVANEFGVRIIAAVSPFDLSSIVSKVDGIEVWSQHLDPILDGSYTGSLQPENAYFHGARGTLLNHAEKNISLEQIKKTLDLIPDGMITCVCAANVEQARKIAELGPDLIAVEPPELIGGDISVTTADPEIIKNTVEAVKSVNPNVDVLTGAGIKNGIDVKIAIELGTVGVLLASGVTKADDPRTVLRDLCSSLNNIK